MLEGAKLLELFRIFERSLFPLHKIEEKPAAIGIDAKVAQETGADVPITIVRDSGARKIKRIPTEIGDDLDAIGIPQFGCFHRASGRGHGERFILAEDANQFLRKFRIDEGFITLNIDDDSVSAEFFGHLRNAIRAARVFVGGEGDLGAEFKSGFRDSHVIRRNNDPVDVRNSAASFPDMANKRFSGQDVQWFSGHAGRSPSSGYDNRSF